jgi:tetratricopeptide (TPR) repeat protein
MRPFVLLVAVIWSTTVFAQDVSNLLASAKEFSRQGDFDNALLVLKKAAQVKPGDIQIEKELAYTYYRAGNYREAVPVVQAMVEREDADVPAFQIAGNVYKGLGDARECDKLYKKGLKKFPNAGALYFEYGELMLTQQQSNEAIKLWEKGIEVDPSYPGNYYHAGKFYYFTGTNPALSLLYSEIFINMESYTVRTAEMKNLLLDAYKKFFLQDPEPNTGKKKPEPGFQQSVANLFMAQGDLASTGITPETLIMIRTRFILGWYESKAAQYPHKLFDQQQFMLREGLFEAYNYWLFGPASNVTAYQQWANANNKKLSDFNYYQKNRVFKMPAGQKYQ